MGRDIFQSFSDSVGICALFCVFNLTFRDSEILECYLHGIDGQILHVERSLALWLQPQSNHQKGIDFTPGELELIHSQEKKVQKLSLGLYLLKRYAFAPKGCILVP